MFDQVVENLRKATETTVQAQQEMFKKWASLWVGVPAAPFMGSEQAQQFQKKWAEVVSDLAKKQREALEVPFKAGLRNLDEAFRLGESRNPEEMRAKTLQLWQQSFDCLRQTYEAQVRDFQAALTRWTELMTKGPA